MTSVEGSDRPRGGEVEGRKRGIVGSFLGRFHDKFGVIFGRERFG